LYLGLIATLGAPALKEPAPAARLAGEWVAESVVHNGQVDPQPQQLRYTFTAGGKWVVVRDGRELDGNNRGYVLDPKARPAIVDFTLDRARADAPKLLSIYRLEGDTLTMCIAMKGRPRPTAFESPDGAHLSLIVFKRVRKE
jgi:uncharacterized protein (TIGR03067 family)